MPIDFRRVGRQDVARLLGFMKKLYAEDGYPFDDARARGALAGLLESEALGAAWLMWQDGEAIGYVVLTLGYSLEYHGRDAFVDELFVEAGQRRRGVATRALEFLREQCLARGVKALHLEVQPGNEPALALYRRAGFRDRGRSLLTMRLRE